MKTRASAGMDKRRWDFGQWLKRQRELSGHTSQKAFAGLLEIDPVQLSRIENGASGISAETLDKAIQILGLEAFDAYERADLLPKGMRASREREEKARKEQASELSELIDMFLSLPRDRQAQILAIIKVLRAENPESLQITNTPSDTTTPPEPGGHFPSDPFIRQPRKGDK